MGGNKYSFAMKRQKKNRKGRGKGKRAPFTTRNVITSSPISKERHSRSHEKSNSTTSHNTPKKGDVWVTIGATPSHQYIIESVQSNPLCNKKELFVYFYEEKQTIAYAKGESPLIVTSMNDFCKFHKPL